METKLCTYCCRNHPISDFRRRWKDSERRHSQCNDCHKAERRERKRKQRQGKAARYATEVVAAERNRHKVIALTAGIVAELGSVAGVVKVYKEAIDAARAAGRHYTVFRLLQATFDLIQIADGLEGERMTGMSTESLEEQVREQTMGIILYHPMIAVWAASQLGWRVTPPAGDDSPLQPDPADG